MKYLRGTCENGGVLLMTIEQKQHLGRTLLIEVNDGYALGCYGLFYLDYAKLLSARWAELTKTVDECAFE